MPKLVEEHAQDTADTPKSGPPEDAPVSTARITSFKPAKATGEPIAPPLSRTPSTDGDDLTPTVGKAAAPAVSR
eukprot:3103977-Pleurochrysis_carterae.AAC.1